MSARCEYAENYDRPDTEPCWGVVETEYLTDACCDCCRGHAWSFMMGDPYEHEFVGPPEPPPPPPVPLTFEERRAKARCANCGEGFTAEDRPNISSTKYAHHAAGGETYFVAGPQVWTHARCQS